MSKCYVCPRQCGVDREKGVGFCRSGSLATVSKTMLHMWEEPPISFKHGSGAVFFSGCPLHCIYCQNNDISFSGEAGKQYSANELAVLFKNLEQSGAENINLVTPTHFVPQIINALEIYKPNIPIVYNSSGYETVETIRSLEKYVDVFLMDFKYSDSALAKKYSSAPDYPEVCKNAIKECLNMRPRIVLKDGKMLRGVIIRHLLLPFCTQNAIGVCDWVGKYAKNAYFSFMSQYTPCIPGLPDQLNRRVTKREYQKVLDYIIESGIENVFVQEFSSASEKYIPKFK